MTKKLALIVVVTLTTVLSTGTLVYFISQKTANTKIEAREDKQTVLFSWPVIAKAKVGESLVIKINANTFNQETSGGEVNLKFDPLKLEFLRADPEKPNLIPTEINKNGEISLVVSKRIKGEDEITKLIFLGKSEGVCNISFLEKSNLPNANGEGNTIKTSIGSQITVEK